MDKAADVTVEADVVDSEVIDEGLLRSLLRRTGRTVATPALEALELLLDDATPSPVRFTMLAALTYLLVPTDLIPVAGFSDDLVALTAMVGIWRNHITPDISRRAQRRLDRWFPLTR